MTDANKVVWLEGLFLRTQHFQQQDRSVKGHSFYETENRAAKKSQ